MKRCVRFWALCSLLSMGGCGSGSKDTGGVSSLSESEFLEQYPTAFCELMERCSPDEFEHNYSNDLQNCVDQLTTWGRERINDGCAYDGGLAGECVELMPTADCTDWNEGVYTESCGGIIDC